MAFEKICTLDDVWEGEMASFAARDGTEVLLVTLAPGQVRAYQSICPHQRFKLIEGDLVGTVLTCKAHLWQFDLNTGKGINPKDCALAVYPTRVEGDDVYVDVAGVVPLSSHT